MTRRTCRPSPDQEPTTVAEAIERAIEVFETIRHQVEEHSRRETILVRVEEVHVSDSGDDTVPTVVLTDPARIEERDIVLIPETIAYEIERGLAALRPFRGLKPPRDRDL